MILDFILGFVIYSLAAAICYMPLVKESPWFIPAGVLLGALANAVWFSIVKQTKDPAQTLILGYFWDAMIVLTYGLMPILFFGVKLNNIQMIGAGFVMLGLLVVKVG